MYPFSLVVVFSFSRFYYFNILLLTSFLVSVDSWLVKKFQNVKQLALWRGLWAEIVQLSRNEEIGASFNILDEDKSYTRHIQSPVLGLMRPVFTFTLAQDFCHKISNMVPTHFHVTKSGPLCKKFGHPHPTPNNLVRNKPVRPFLKTCYILNPENSKSRTEKIENMATFQHEEWI